MFIFVIYTQHTIPLLLYHTVSTHMTDPNAPSSSVFVAHRKSCVDTTARGRHRKTKTTSMTMSRSHNNFFSIFIQLFVVVGRAFRFTRASQTKKMPQACVLCLCAIDTGHRAAKRKTCYIKKLSFFIMFLIFICVPNFVSSLLLRWNFCCCYCCYCLLLRVLTTWTLIFALYFLGFCSMFSTHPQK